MQTPASIAKHPIHPMLVNFPIGLWVFPLICDLIGLTVAAVPGFIDLLFYKGFSPAGEENRADPHGDQFERGGVCAVNMGIRIGGPASLEAPIILSAIRVCAIAVSGWLGGQMVHVHGVGVEGRD